MPADFELDLATHDMIIDNGDARLIGLTAAQAADGRDTRGRAVGQRAKIKLLTDRGEYDHDLDAGFPYSQEVFPRRASGQDEVRARAIALLGDDEEVRRVEDVTLELTRAVRQIRIGATIVTIFGSIPLALQVEV